MSLINQTKDKLNTSCVDEKKIESLYLDYQEREIKKEKLRKAIDKVKFFIN